MLLTAARHYTFLILKRKGYLMGTKILGPAFLALGCWAAPPERHAGPLLETYRETMMVAKACLHRPACLTRLGHEHRLAVDTHCYHGPTKCVRLEDCLKRHIEGVYANCDHSPVCPTAISHFNAARRAAGLLPIVLP